MALVSLLDVPPVEIVLLFSYQQMKRMGKQ